MKKRKRRRSLSEMRPIIAGYRSYDGTKKEYCSTRGLSPDTLDYWRRRIKEEEDLVESKRIVAKGQPKQVGFVSIPGPRKASESAFTTSSAYTLHLPDGKRLDLPRTTPIELLTQLLQIQV